MVKVKIMMRRLTRKSKSYANKPGFTLLIFILALADYFVFVIPMIAVLVGSAAINPKHWLRFAIGCSLGSTLGVFIFANCVRHFGISFIEWIAPTLLQSSFWTTSEHWIEKFGIGAVAMISILPVTDHPMIALISLTDAALFPMMVVVVITKLIKFTTFSWMAVYAPKRLMKIKEVKKEMDEVS